MFCHHGQVHACVSQGNAMCNHVLLDTCMFRNFFWLEVSGAKQFSDTVRQLLFRCCLTSKVVCVHKACGVKLAGMLVF